MDTDFIALDDKVLIKPLGFTGTVIGIAFYTYHVPQVQIEYVNFDRVVVNGWYKAYHLEKINPEAKGKINENVVQLKK